MAEQNTTQTTVDVAVASQTAKANHADVKKAVYFAIASSVNDLLLIPVFTILACAFGCAGFGLAEVAQCTDIYGDKQDCLCDGQYEYTYSDNECEDDSFWGMGPLLLGVCGVFMYEGLYGIAAQLFLIIYHVLYGEKSLLESFVAGVTLNGERKEWAKTIFGIRMIELIGCIAIVATYTPLNCGCTDSSNDIYELTMEGEFRESSYVLFVISIILIVMFLISRRILMCLIANIKITTETNVLLFRMQYVSTE